MSPPIRTPDGNEVSEIVLPDGSTASQVIGPDGNVVFEAPPEIPDSGIARYDFEQNVEDSWNNNDGTDDTSTGYSTDSKVNSYSKVFDDSQNDYIDIPIVDQSPIAIAGWVKWDTIGSQMTIAASWGSAGDQNGAILNKTSSDNIRCFIDNDSVTYTGYTISADTWEFVGVNINGDLSNVELYVNEAINASGDLSSESLTSGTYDIGRRADGAYYLDGHIDDLRFFDKTLTESEFDNLRTTGSI